MVTFRKHYDPLSGSLSMVTQEGSLVQKYDVYNKEYIPDRRIRPTAIHPECGITDPAGILSNGVVNQFLTDISWYQGEMIPENIILDSNKDFIIDRSSNTNNRGRITIYKNVPFDKPLVLSFSATFVDLVGGRVRRRLSFQGSITLTSSTFADAPLTFIPFCPRGDTFNPLTDMTYLSLVGDLKAGNELIPQAHWWYRKTASGLKPLGSEYDGYKSREIKIPTSEIGKDAHYVCRIKDCRHELADLQETYLNNELGKITDCPRNLLAKQYLLDLNEEMRQGIVIEGEDADGKYLCISHPETVYKLNGGKEHRDLFSGKIKFKENTAYSLRISCKYVDPNGENKIGGYLLFVYTDGTTKGCSIYAYNTLKEGRVTSDPTKTLSHISWTYGHVVPLYIYDIQITETYNHNVLKGDTEEVAVVALDPSDTNKYRRIEISNNLGANWRVTVKVDDIENVSGEATEYTVSLLQDGNVITESKNLSPVYKAHTFLINDKYNPSGDPAYLALYAGKALNTAGCSVKYKNVQMHTGLYALNVLGRDIEELVVGDGGEDKFQCGKENINEMLGVGNKYTLSVDEIIDIKGTPAKYTVFIQQIINGSGVIVSDSLTISQNAKNVVLTINDKYVVGTNATVVLYAGESGRTAGNMVQFKNVRLLLGESVLPSIPPYSPHFIPAAPDIESMAGLITLPDGYRPDGDPTGFEEYDYTLTTAYPPDKWKICTPYGSSADGLIDIPSDVSVFPAWAEISTADGIVKNPQKYYSLDWGNGKRGISTMLDASELSVDLLTLNPVLYRGLDKVKYAAKGVTLKISELEDIAAGSRIIVEIPPHIPSATGFVNARKNGIGFSIAYKANGDASIFIYGDSLRKSAVLNGIQNTIQRFEFKIGATLEESQFYINGSLYTGAFGGDNIGGGSLFSVDRYSIASLIEIYSPDSALLHKWDFQGATITERLSDKSDAANKISLLTLSDFELVPM